MRCKKQAAQFTRRISMKLKSLVISGLLSVFCTTTAFAAIPKAPDVLRGAGWDVLEVLHCTASGQDITFKTFIRKNIITQEIVDVIFVNGVWLQETDRVWRDDEVIAEEIYIRSANRTGTWMFYSPIEELGIRSAMSQRWKKAGVDVTEKLTCDMPMGQ